MTSGDSTIYDDGTYLRMHPTWHVEDSAWKARQVLRLMKRNHLTPSSIGEIGCGAGEVLRQLRDSVDGTVRFVGYDVSRDAYDLAQSRQETNLTFRCGDLLHDQDVSFDLLLAIDVVEHIDDYRGFLRALRTKAKLKMFHIPLDLSVYSLLRDYPSTSREVSGHLHYFTKETALRSLVDSGYAVRDFMYTRVSIEVEQPGFSKILLKLPRRMAFSLSPDHAARILGGFSLLVLAE